MSYWVSILYHISLIIRRTWTDSWVNIVHLFQYISNKMQGYAVYFIWKLLYMFWVVDCVWNVMAHAQKPDLVFRRNGRVHLNWQRGQFSRLLAAEVCASAVVMLDTPCSEVVWRYWLHIPFVSFPFTSPPVRHRVLSRFNWTLLPPIIRRRKQLYLQHLVFVTPLLLLVAIAAGSSNGVTNTRCCR